MPMHKLSEGPITMLVADCTTVEGKFGMQYRITSAAGVDVYVNVAAFDRQMKRISLDPDTIVGKTIHLEQVQKDGTTFTNLSLAPTGADTGPASAGPRPATASPAKARMTLPDAAALYGECMDHAIAVFGVRVQNLEIPVTAESLHSVATTLFLTVAGRA